MAARKPPAKIPGDAQSRIDTLELKLADLTEQHHKVLRWWNEERDKVERLKANLEQAHSALQSIAVLSTLAKDATAFRDADEIPF